MTDNEIIDVVTSAFRNTRRPTTFTSSHHCPECREHEELFQGRDRERITIQDLEYCGYHPLIHLNPEAFRYYLPALVRLALRNPSSPLLYNLITSYLLQAPRNKDDSEPPSLTAAHELWVKKRIGDLTAKQRASLVCFLCHVRETRSEWLASEEQLAEAIDEAMCGLLRV